MHDLYLQVSCTVRSSLLQFKSSSFVTHLHLLFLLVQLEVAILWVNLLCCFQQLKRKTSQWVQGLHVNTASTWLIDDAVSRCIPPCCVCTDSAGSHSLLSDLTAAVDVQGDWWRSWRTSRLLTQLCRLLNPFCESLVLRSTNEGFRVRARANVLLQNQCLFSIARHNSKVKVEWLWQIHK